jgi:hypothetical protein
VESGDKVRSEKTEKKEKSKKKERGNFIPCIRVKGIRDNLIFF